MTKRISLGLSVLVVAVAVGGCGKKIAEPVEMVPLEKVPAAVMKTAKDKLPDVKFESAWTKKEDGQLIYEVRGKTSTGKTLEVEVKPDGTFVEIE